MKDSKTASRYAKALLGLSQEGGKIEEVMADMNSLSETLAESADLRSLVKNPVIKGEEKLKVFTALFGSQFNELTMNTIQLLVNNKRETLLAETAKQFVGMYKESKNIVTAEVTSAIQLDEEQKKSILSLLKHNGEVEIVEHIDASLIGGFIVRVGDKQIDASISTKFKNLRKEISLN